MQLAQESRHANYVCFESLRVVLFFFSIFFGTCQLDPPVIMATRMVLRLTYDNRTKNVAVPLDKDLGSAETSAEIARAFGVSAGRVESIAVIHPRSNNDGLSRYEAIPLNLNWHDLAHPANARIKGLLFNGQDGQWKVEVKFAIERSFREHE